MREDFLNQGIKDIITRHPAVGEILDEYGVGCAPCGVGTCLLKDIVKIHALAPEAEREMMGRIEAAVRAGGGPPAGGASPISPAPAKVRTAAPRAPARVSPIMRKLMDEHVLIKRLLAVVPRFLHAMDLGTPAGRQKVLDVVEFIRSYADRYHHAKEEEILFRRFDEGLDILKVMRQDHQAARAHVQAICEAVPQQDRKGAAEHLEAYVKLLTEHIAKEDEVLYPWMDRQLSDRQVGELFSMFRQVDAQFGDAPERCRRFVESLEDGLSKPPGPGRVPFRDGTALAPLEEKR